MKKNWQEKSIGDILKLEYGKPLDEADRSTSGRYPVYGANGEKDRTDKFYHDKPSIIVGRKGSAGEVNLAENKFWPLDVTYFVTFDENQYDLHFLYYLLATLELTKLAKGVKPGINRNEVYSQVTRVPSLAEQQRIVGLLDEAFAGLATAQANAVKNGQSARALFKVHLNQVLDRGGDDWKQITFGDAVVQSRGGISIKSSEYSESGIPVLTKGDIKPFGKIEHGGKYVKEAHVKKQRWPVADPGDLIVATRDLKASAPFLGLVSRVPKDRPYLVNQGATYFKVDQSLVVPDYFVYWCCCARYRAHVVTKKSGATQVHIREGDLFSAPLSLPPLKDQRLIIEKLDQLLCESGRLQSIYQQKLAALEALKKSLLHQAFTGRL